MPDRRDATPTNGQVPSTTEPRPEGDPAAEDAVEPESARQLIGQQLKSWRLKRHISQAGLARAAGIDQTSISNYEAGKRELRVSTLIRIAHALNVRVEDLITSQIQRAILDQPD